MQGTGKGPVGQMCREEAAAGRTDARVGLGPKGLVIDRAREEVGVVGSEAVVLMGRPVRSMVARACREGRGCMGRVGEPSLLDCDDEEGGEFWCSS